ncbi:hypothetical protein FRC07_011542 [Ceratobasidium sp. 392]|nr:hypothetical protein FRC07_011542 [Ceratobasidium sp. 392]
MSSSSNLPKRGATHRVLTLPTHDKRKADSLTESHTTQPYGKRTIKSESWACLSTTTTPFRPGSSRHRKEGSGNSASVTRTSTHSKRHTTDAAYVVSSATTSLATAQTPQQLEMDHYLESELQGSIFCDPNFTRNFLATDSIRLQSVLEDCEDDLNALRFSEHVTRERQLYEPICQVLDIIKHAVDANGPGFVDVSAEPIPSHHDDIVGIKPDLALFEGATRHWETIRMPIEIKRQATYLKTGMKQLARYARAVFAHQLHRRHLYGMVVCKWAATFVRFDRSGMLYSKPIDVRDQEFREAFAGLMMLDEEAFGYDTAFTTRARNDGRLEYYVDLPANAFPLEDGTTIPTDAGPDLAADTSTPTPGSSNQPNVSTRRLKVIRVLCHRKSIRGRATVVLRVREVLRPGILEEPEEARSGTKTRSRTKKEQQPAQELELLGTQDYVLKLMWRDPKKKPEGEVLERLVGIYGVAQHMWHSDAFRACDSSSCARPAGRSCEHCVDRTPDRDRVLVAKNMNDLDIEIPNEAEGEEETQYKAVNTDEYSEAYAQRTRRIYCRLLMSTVGSSLCVAESPRQFLQAVLDAILGYWRIVNKGLLHRDISDGNVLMLQEGQGYGYREWKTPRTAIEQDPTLEESERLLQNILAKLDRDPSGMLNDFDLFSTHNLMGDLFLGSSSAQHEESGLEGTGERGSKRRKLNPNASASSGSTKGEAKEAPTEQSSITHVAEADKGVCKDVDFRTGTPTFMSVRVLNVKIGERYEHSFMDDLESFFWLILWCIAEHVDSVGAKPTREAQEMLDLLDQSNLTNIKNQKRSVLGCCADEDGAEMETTLVSWENAWAKDPAIVTLVLEMGAYFKGVKRFKLAELSDYTPNKVFPIIVDMVMRAVEHSNPAALTAAEAVEGGGGSDLD